MPPEPPAFYSPPLSLVAAGFASAALPLSVFLLLGSFLDATPALAMVLFPATTALLGTGFWRSLVVGRRQARKRGAAAGILASLLAYPVAWILAYLIAEVAENFGIELFQDLRPGLLLQNAWAFAVATLAVTGWLTIPAAGLAGYLFARRRRGVEDPKSLRPYPRSVRTAFLSTVAAVALASTLGRDAPSPLLHWLMIADLFVAAPMAAAVAWYLESGKGWILPHGGTLSGAATGLAVHPLLCFLFFSSPDIYTAQPSDTLLKAVPFALLGWLIAISAGALAAALVVWRHDGP
jgi:hypothetical protein